MRGKDVMEEGKDVSSMETEPQRGAKAAKTNQSKSQTKVAPRDRGCDLRIKVSSWNPALVLDGSPFPTNSFIKDLQQGKAGYVADAVEQALLLPSDMTELRTLRTHEVFVGLKRDLAKVSQILRSSFILLLLYLFTYFSFSLCFLRRLSKLPLGPRSWWTTPTSNTKARKEGGLLLWRPSTWLRRA